MKIKKKLIEVALPLEAINQASAQEKQPGIGAHPRGLHLWWARRPLATARAVIFSQLVDDPSAHPDLFPSEKAQETERQRLFKIIKDLVKWENSTNEIVLQQARDEIWKSWRHTCAENADHPQAKELFDRFKLPAFHDPFAGGGALPLEAQRLGLDSFASDLNPVAVVINKSMIEIPPKFINKQPVNSAWQDKPDAEKAMTNWEGSQGLVDDIRFYGQIMQEEAEKKIGHLYPQVEITALIAKDRPDLEIYIGKKLNVLTWIWARTVKSPNPAFSKIDVPLATTFMLNSKPGKEVYIDPLFENGNYRFTVKVGKPKDGTSIKNGTKLSRGANFYCLMSKSPMTQEHIRKEFQGKRSGIKLMAIVVEGNRNRIYLPPTPEQEDIAKNTIPAWQPDQEMNQDSSNLVSGRGYGITHWHEIFTSRQLTSLITFVDFLELIKEKIKTDAISSELLDDDKKLDEGGLNASAYAEAICVYLSFAIDRLADYNSSITTWKPSGEQVMQTFKRQALPMTWDFPESNVIGHSSICWLNAIKYTADNLLVTASYKIPTHGIASQEDASTQTVSNGKIISTDPPYYDNIAYADLSDFFYIWLRKSLKQTFPSLFSTLTVPKIEELVATSYRHGGRIAAEKFFLDGMTQVMHRLAEQAHPSFPVTIYYAFKQAETDEDEGVTNTGWDTFLAAIIKAGFVITGTWPMRTELSNRMISSGTNALASSIVLVCRRRPADAQIATRRDFVAELKSSLPKALMHLQAGNIAPVDLAQAAIGPGMAIYTQYAKVVDAGGNEISVRAALSLINQVLDEALAQQDLDFDADTRWALTWFEQSGFAENDYGLAEQLSKSKNTSVSGLVEAGIIFSRAGKVRLLKPNELSIDWDPITDKRLTVWEMVHHLIRVLESNGEKAAAIIVKKLENQAEIARELCYRLYTICERKRRSNEAMAYNGLVQSWPEIQRLSKEADQFVLTPTENINFERE